MSLSIRKNATDAPDGTFLVRTEGLAELDQAELEVAGIPREIVEVAAKLIDYVIEGVIEQEGAHLVANERVGIPLSVAGHDEFPAVFLAVFAAEEEAPRRGLFARLVRKGSRGVLRLRDFPGDDPGPPLQALATLMIHRANCRVSMGDDAGAIAELRQSIALVPGDDAAPPPPAATYQGALFNWQNYLSRKRLAELVAPEERATLLADLYGRFDWVARRELGCRVADLEGLREEQLVVDAMHIIEHNRSHPQLRPGPTPALRMMANPIWEGQRGGWKRTVTVIPAGFVEYVHGRSLGTPDAVSAMAELAAQCVLRHAAEPWTLLALTEGARSTYCGFDTSTADEIDAPSPALLLLSSVIAESARFRHAGASYEELGRVFGLDGATPSVPESLAAKMNELEPWETEQYVATIAREDQP